MELLKAEEFPLKLQEFENFLKKKALSDRYIRNCCSTIKYYFVTTGKFDIETINNFFISKKGVRNYNYIYAFKLFFVFLNKKELALELAKMKILPNKTSGNLYPKDLLKKVISNINEPIYRLIALIQYESGIRSFEVVQIKKSDLKYDEDGDLFIYIPEPKGGRKAKRAYLSRRTETVLKIVNEKFKKDYLFISPGNNKDFTTAVDTMNRYYRKALQKAVKSTFGATQLRSHDFRRNFAADIYKKTGDIMQVQRTLDHSSITTTMKYIEGIRTDKKKLTRSIRED